MVYGTVASFDVLTQSFYVNSQKSEKFPPYVACIEGVPNEIRLTYPDRFSDIVMEGH